MAYKIENIDAKKTAVMVIDMQNDFIKEGFPMYLPMGNGIVPRLKEFLTECRSRGMQVIYTTQTHRENGADMGYYGAIMEPIGAHVVLKEGTEGAQVYEEIAPKEQDMTIIKHNYSSFYATELDVILRTLKIDTVVITGVCTDMCCLSTARDALNHGYHVAFLSDLTATMDYPDMGYGAKSAKEIHETVLSILKLTTADVMTSEEFLAK